MSREMKKDIAVYEANLKGLSLAVEEGGLDGDEIVSMFTYRDAIEEALDRGDVHLLDVFRVIDLDEYLRQQAEQIVTRLDLAAYRRDVQPHESHWWWYLDEWLATRSETIYRPQKAWQRVAESPDPDAMPERSNTTGEQD